MILSELSAHIDDPDAYSAAYDANAEELAALLADSEWIKFNNGKLAVILPDRVIVADSEAELEDACDQLNVEIDEYNYVQVFIQDTEGNMVTVLCFDEQLWDEWDDLQAEEDEEVVINDGETLFSFLRRHFLRRSRDSADASISEPMSQGVQLIGADSIVDRQKKVAAVSAVIAIVVVGGMAYLHKYCADNLDAVVCPDLTNSYYDVSFDIFSGTRVK